jgi:xylono-1,5-lactonase
MAVECVWPVAAKLGEGPFWSAPEEAVWFVDIKGRAIHRYHEPSGDTRTWPAPAEPGFVLPTKDGRFIAGLQTGLHWFDPSSGAFERLEPIEAQLPHNRLNDGFVAADGHLWFGSMDDEEKAPTGALYQRLDGGSVKRDAPYVITNGPTESVDGRVLYHVDTLEKVIYAFDKASDGTLSNRRVFTRMEPEDGHPDGPITDSTGNIWCSLYGGWGVNRYDSEGRKLSKLMLPVSNVTKAAFGGKDLRTLYVTSAWKGLSPEDRAKQPLAGGLFRVRVDVAGLPQGLISHGL